MFIKPMNKVITFFVHVFIMGLCINVIKHFLLIYTKNELGGTDLLIGVIPGFMDFMSLPFMIYSKELFGFFGIHYGLHVATLTYVIRGVMYAALSRGQANYILLTEPLHGCMFTLYWVGSVEYTKTITTTRDYSFVMGITNSLFYSVSSVAAGWLGSIIYYDYGGLVMWNVFTVVAIVWAIILEILVRFKI